MSQGNRVSPSPTSSPDHRVDTHQLQEIGHDRGSPHGQRNTLEDEDNIIGERGTPEDSSNQSHHYDDDFHTDDGSVRKDSPDVQLTNHDDAIKSPDLQTTNQDGEAIGRESPDIQLPVLADETESENVITNTTDKAPGESEYRDQGYERIYTPALPKADTLEESHYDLPTPPPTYQEDSTLSETPPRFPPEKGISELNQSYKQSGTHVLPPIGANRITPADQATVHRAEVRQRLVEGQRSGGDSQVYNVSHEVLLERKKSLIIGADGNTDGAGCCGWLLYIFSILLIIISLPFSLMLTIKVVQEYERAVIFRLGRLPLGGAKGPGIFFIIPCIESYSKVDLRTVSFDVPPQEVLTKDSVTVSVDAVVYYRVSNPTVSVANVENAHHSTRLLAQTTLRNILGTKNMSEILSDRESISVGMQSTLDSATDRWGIKVERVEIKDVRLPVQLQRAMAAEAEAAREARAKVIAAEGEHKASRALKEAADVMGQSSSALQLRYLQTLSSISAEKNSTIIFPLPIDMLQSFMKKGK